MESAEKAQYRITGIVDTFDTEGNVNGTLEVGSVHEFSVELGTSLVEKGLAELFVDEAATASEEDKQPGEGAEGSANEASSTEDSGAEGSAGEAKDGEVE